MTYVTGGTIDDGDYNLFISGTTTGAANHSVQNLNSLWSAGTGDRGYGQGGSIAAVSAGTTITATQWANLFNRINTIASHQGSTVTSHPAPSTGDDIVAYNTLNGAITTIWNNRLNCAASGTTITAGGSVNRTTAWASTLTFVMSVQFASVSQRRYFFNTGGRVNISLSRSGGDATTKNSSWTSLLSACGTLVLTAASGANQANIAGTNYFGFNKIGGSGTEVTLATNIGFHNLTSTYQTVFLKSSTTALYTENQVRVRARTNGNNVEFEVQLTDNDDDQGPDDVVNGTTNCTLTAIPAATTHIGNSWGTVTLSGTQSGPDIPVFTDPGIFYVGEEFTSTGASAINLPPDIEEGDVVLFLQVENDGAIAPPTGSTALVSNSFIMMSRVSRYVVPASPPATLPGFTSSGGGVIAIAFRGVDPTNPIDVVSTALGGQPFGASWSSPDVTTTVADAMVVRFVATMHQLPTFMQYVTSISIPGQEGQAWVELKNDPLVNMVRADAAWYKQASAGPTGTALWTETPNQNRYWFSYTVALKPAP
jgi:hypothetical protein